ncbi:MAG: glycosyltransferase family 39 protein [Bryobacteraceae bacterium]
MLLAALLSAGAIWFVLDRSYILYYGDAQAHVNTARRIVDSRTPGFDQLGTVWLPLPHLLMLPLVARDDLWRNGLAGSIPSGVFFVVGVALLFAAVRRTLGSASAGAATAAAFALNPNVLYLQSIPMTESIFFGCLAGVLYFSVLFGESQSLWSVAAAGVAAAAATLTRYDGWFLLPFAALYFLFAAKRRRLVAALLFSIVAVLGPAAWLAHNWYYSGDALDFFRGPYSAKAIQGVARYPGWGDWRLAWDHFRAAAWLCAGTPLVWIGCAGVAGAILKKSFWPVLLLAMPPAFYVWNLHSGDSPIYAPHLKPFSYYNTRYGTALLPLLALGVGGLVAWIPSRWRAAGAALAVLAVVAPWLLNPAPEEWITWKESQVNSGARRAWTAEGARFLQENYRPGSGIFTTFGDVTGIYAAAGIPLRETLTWDNWPHWPSAVARPELFLREEWAVAIAGDKVQTTATRSTILAIRRAPGAGAMRYRLVRLIAVKGAPVVEIYKGQLEGTRILENANSVYEGPRGAQ